MTFPRGRTRHDGYDKDADDDGYAKDADDDAYDADGDGDGNDGAKKDCRAAAQ